MTTVTTLLTSLGGLGVQILVLLEVFLRLIGFWGLGYFTVFWRIPRVMATGVLVYMDVYRVPKILTGSHRVKRDENPSNGSEKIL